MGGWWVVVGDGHGWLGAVGLEGGFVEGIEQEQQEGQDEEGGEQTFCLIHFDWFDLAAGFGPALRTIYFPETFYNTA